MCVCVCVCVYECVCVSVCLCVGGCGCGCRYNCCSALPDIFNCYHMMLMIFAEIIISCPGGACQCNLCSSVGADNKCMMNVIVLL